jgi:hypothetical protein
VSGALALLGRLVAVEDTAVAVPAAPPADPLWEIIGGPKEGRLAAAVACGDQRRVDELVARLLDDPRLGPRIGVAVSLRVAEGYWGREVPA